MLAITAKVKLLKKEVEEARNVSIKIIESLKKVTENSDLRPSIGIYTETIPEWKILTDERASMILAIRKICTGELTIPTSITQFDNFEQELAMVDSWLQVPKK